MNKYRRFVVIVMVLETAIILGATILLRSSQQSDYGRGYRVESERAAKELRSGKHPDELDMKQYPSLLKIKVFDTKQEDNDDYQVKDINGTLYQFSYRHQDNNYQLSVFYMMSVVLLAGTMLLLWFIGKKMIQPFSRMSDLTVQLAKGNLSIPVHEEKSKFFGKFLWGMDMLREKLEQDREKELALMKDRKTLILSLSHDIKTPLSAIELYIKALSAGLYNTEEKRQQVVEGIERNVAEIKNYVSEIVAASREDFLHLEVKKGEFYLHDLAKEISLYYEEKMQRYHIEFMVDREENCLLHGDYDRVVEVLQNICENAIKYGDKKRIQISFEEEENYKLITVENGGCTLKEEEIPHIFDSFYRGSNSEREKGSGLGLYICKNLLQKMDGEIFAKKEGDSFLITIVLRKV